MVASRAGRARRRFATLPNPAVDDFNEGLF